MSDVCINFAGQNQGKKSSKKKRYEKRVKAISPSVILTAENGGGNPLGSLFILFVLLFVSDWTLFDVVCGTFGLLFSLVFPLFITVGFILCE